MSGCKTDPLPNKTADAVVTQSFRQLNGAPAMRRGAIQQEDSYSVGPGMVG